jgi:hypothetical protein
MGRWFFLIAFALALEGCVTTEQQLAIDDQQCHSYGFAGGTQGYAQCRMNLDMQRQQARIEAGNAFADSLDAAAYNYSHPVAPPAYYQPPPIIPSCADGYACAGRTLQGDGLYH